MSAEEGGPGESRRDGTNGARQRASPEAAFRRILADGSAAIAAMRGKASAGSLAALVKAHVPPEWRSPRRLLLVAASLLVVIGLILATRPKATTMPPSHPAPGTTVFQVGNRVTLRFVHSTGSVDVRSGPDGQVSITENRNGIPDAIHTSYRQQGDVITVNVSVDNGLMLATWVDFNVKVPRDTSANVAVAAGTLRATGLTGNLALQDTNGSIWAKNVSGAIALQTVSGSINTSKVNGQVSASTNNGTITTISTRLQGPSRMQAQNGTINFHGSLAPGCRAVFRNTKGATGVTLPGSSSVFVDARARSGSINSEFSSVHVVSNSAGLVAKGRVGRDAPARLSIQTVSGSIDLNRGT